MGMEFSFVASHCDANSAVTFRCLALGGIDSPSSTIRTSRLDLLTWLGESNQSVLGAWQDKPSQSRALACLARHTTARWSCSETRHFHQGIPGFSWQIHVPACHHAACRRLMAMKSAAAIVGGGYW